MVHGMEQPKDKNDICTNPDCDRGDQLYPKDCRSLLPHFKSGTFHKDGLICTWCKTVYLFKENENEEPNNPRTS
jgi:hypothetical protein